ncbi:MAG: NAD(P)H-hydrate epimerase [Sphingomonadales bacterium]|nr:NAD(P)H-hydrate epimerase [Sphingomonadales bacterium]
MRAAEEALIAAGTSVDALMQVAGHGAADWVWRVSAGHKVTVLCGPGNNGGDGYVLAEAIRARGCKVAVVAACDPATDAARNARALYRGEVLGPEAEAHGEVFVDCLFGSGLTRPLSDPHYALLTRLAASHHKRVAVDLPSGVDSDSGAGLNEALPRYDLTVALGAWKFAHVLMPSRALAGQCRLVGIGVAEVPGAARMVEKPLLRRPRHRDNKFSRGMVLLVAGAMPGAAVLAGSAAIRGGAGYVKVAGGQGLPPELVAVPGDLDAALADRRIGAVLAGPGLGRDDAARARLGAVLARPHRALVLDADALNLLGPGLPSVAGAVLTPHGGEMAALEAAFGLEGGGSKVARATALAARLQATVVFKGADTVIAAPDGRIACGPHAPVWLAMAGTGDVLAGLLAARLATGAEPFTAACEAVWLHGEAAYLAGPAFTAPDLAAAVPAALASAI